MVMRTKSRATVVVVFCSPPAKLSMPALVSVMTSSVRSGAISLTLPTIVVFPTPKPPAISIFAATALSVRPVVLEIADSIEHLLHHVEVWRNGLPARSKYDEVTLDEVADQHLRHAHRQIQLRGHLGHRARIGAQPQHVGVLGLDQRG